MVESMISRALLSKLISGTMQRTIGILSEWTIFYITLQQDDKVQITAVFPWWLRSHAV